MTDLLGRGNMQLSDWLFEHKQWRAKCTQYRKALTMSAA